MGVAVEDGAGCVVVGYSDGAGEVAGYVGDVDGGGVVGTVDVGSV
ncbi:hypothetical protein FHS29_003344 [Saccharothrix tamanrassetensis]|uniref:Uncharacterized protein n=1 Tax=Saccharothrix tamanrassetensis TaxID=1051531 RepID=A0A841CH91_9PSEU|nr:hypothetical protein [Saccharothrix tamanrassetensis]MBB5956751.1 hypothetical protein [Saccharothrix tamanrassetensis]